MLQRRTVVMVVLLILVAATVGIAAMVLDDSQAIVAGVKNPGTVVVMDGAGKVIKSFGEGRTPALSPNGRFICFGSAFGLIIADVNFPSRQYQATNDPSDEAPAWSPDGRLIVFVRQAPASPHRLNLLNVNNVRRPLELGEVAPAQIADQQHPDWKSNILVWDVNKTDENIDDRKVVDMNLATGEIVDVVDIAGQSTWNATLSPGLSKVAYVFDGNIYLKKAGTPASEEGEIFAFGENPAFSPTGLGIFFQAGSEIVYAALDGSVERDLGEGAYPSAAFSRRVKTSSSFTRLR